ncbi:hypothetical protein LIA77_00885 [Sarocladium implicatum]|nr:hypothetical protein LIA77_00885 [Sarocladium implicatum]
MRNSEYSSNTFTTGHRSSLLGLSLVFLLVLPVRAWRQPGRLQLASEKQGCLSVGLGSFSWAKAHGIDTSAFGEQTLWESRCEDCVGPLECDTRRVLFLFFFSPGEEGRY